METPELMKMLAPIVLFVYNRPGHTLRMLQTLLRNDLASESLLIIFSDGPKTDAGDISKVRKVREVIRQRKWCGEVRIIESEKNKGLAASVVAGVTQIVNEFGKIIVLEDDLLLAQGFLKYMNNALDMYEKEEQVMHVSAYMFPTRKKLSDTFFLKGVTSTWGWATWKRAWADFRQDASALADEIARNRAVREFNFNDSMDYYKMLLDNMAGKNDSWGIRWYASVFLREGYALWPGISLVENIGFDHSGVHSRPNVSYIPLKRTNTVLLSKQEINDFSKGRKAMINFYHKLNHHGISYRIQIKTKELLCRILQDKK